jgi:hypothetical protein
MCILDRVCWRSSLVYCSCSAPFLVSRCARELPWQHINPPREPCMLCYMCIRCHPSNRLQSDGVLVAQAATGRQCALVHLQAQLAAGTSYPVGETSVCHKILLHTLTILLTSAKQKPRFQFRGMCKSRLSDTVTRGAAFEHCAQGLQLCSQYAYMYIRAWCMCKRISPFLMLF